MVVVPAVIPVVRPVVATIVATEVLLLTHVPPAVASISVIDALTHTLPGTVIADGDGLTVTGAVT